MKRRFKRILSVLLVVVMIVGSAPLSGFAGLELPNLADLFTLKADAAAYSGKCGDNLTWSLDTDTGVLTISGTGDMYDWSYGSYAPWYSKRSSVKTVVIGDSVTSIGKYAFYGCTGLTSVTIPDSVTSIGNGAFRTCTGLTSITVKEGNPNYSSDEYGVLFNKDKTLLIQYPIGNTRTSYTIPDSVTSIGGAAFSDCTRLTSVTIPDSVTSIGSSVFNNCNNIYILVYKNSFAEQYATDNSLKYCIISQIPEDADTVSGKVTNSFLWSIDKTTGTLTLDCIGTMISFENDVAPWIQYEEYIKHIVINDGCTNISKNAFMLCNNVESVLIPDSVTKIDNYAFFGCTGLKELTMPCSAKIYNGQYTFYNCSNIEKVTLAKGIGTMQNYGTSSSASSSITDYDYTPWYISRNSIKEIIIEDGVQNIGNDAFCFCTSLARITIPDSVTSIGDSAFYYCAGLQSITIPDRVTSIDRYAFSGCTGLQSITIPDNVTSIGDSVFNGCVSLTSIIISESVTSIGFAAFGDCASLTSITIPDSVTSIGRFAFFNCTGLTSITIGNSVTSIGGGAFEGCTGLMSIAIPDSVTSIGSSAFYGCTGLTSITIPDSITNIDDYVFQNCTGITNITIPDSVTSIGSSAFEGCTGLTSLKIPDSVTYLGCGVLNSCTNLISIEIGNGVTEIYNSDFKNLTNLKSVTIGTGVTTIGDYAFNGCTSLEEIVIPYSVNSIGTAAFSGCSNLGSLTVYSRNCTFADDATAYYTTIYGFTGSTAETYANEKGFDFVAIDDIHEHIYDNACDKICNLCGDERTVGEHNFGDFRVTKEPTCTEQGEKARTCSICNFEDVQAIPATGHTYDNDCDTDCNVCGAVRVPPHSDNDTNGICDNCGAYLSDIALSTVKDVAVSAGETVYLKFTAPYTGRYTFYSSSSSDTYGYVCDSNKKSLASDDDSGSNNNFLITTTLTQGTVYYLGVKYYNSSNSGTIPVTINYICDHTSTHTEHKDSTCNEHGYDKSICDICGATISTTELPYKHDYVATVTDSTCTEQGYTTYTCSLCGDSYTADYTEPLNHPHKTWRVTKNPTATSTGLMTETCDLCGAKTGEMEIPMLIPNFVTGITVSPNRLALNVGETANLTAVITPDTAENKNVIWSSSDTDIATVADGVVTAKTPGVAMIIVQSEDGGYKDFCVVRIASLTPANGAVVDNENGLIYGISSNSAGINSYVNTVDDTMTVECDSALLGTGSVVNIVKDDVIVDSYKIVLFGDVNGDSWYDGQDAITVSCLANGMLTREQVGEAVWTAADCNHDGVIDQLDVDLLNQAGVLLSSVDQTKTQAELIETSAEYNEYLSLIDQMGSEDTTETPTQDESGSFFTRIIAFIESIIKILNTFFTKII